MVVVMAWGRCHACGLIKIELMIEHLCKQCREERAARRP